MKEKDDEESEDEPANDRGRRGPVRFPVPAPAGRKVTPRITNSRVSLAEVRVTGSRIVRQDAGMFTDAIAQ